MTAVSFRNFSVLAGNCEPSVSALLQVIIRQTCEGRAVPCVTIAGRLEELLNSTQLDRFDLCILIVNNISVGNNWNKERIERVIESIRMLKADGRMPVLAISAYRDGPGFEQRVLKAGAFALLDYPPPVDRLRHAVLTCLEQKDVRGDLTSRGAASCQGV
jgi:DNA-binding NtrC family response regulator